MLIFVIIHVIFSVIPNIFSIIITTIGEFAMKKFFGFTLAEILITLGIIGVVAAITIPILNSQTTHKKLQTQFKKAYAELNQAARTFYSDTDVPVHDYDILLKAGVDTTTGGGWNNDALLKKFLSYYQGASAESTNFSWSKFDSVHKIKNLNFNGQVITSYPCDQSRVYKDAVGRLYVMDDTSTAYGTALDYGPKICVDTNGIDKPNRWGYDRFVFVFTEESAVIPYTGSTWASLGKNLTDPAKIAKYCSQDTTTPAHTCAYFAISDKSPTGNGSYFYDYLKKNKSL